MNKQEFQKEMRKAEKLQKTGDEFYWYAYQVGLRQGYQPFLSKGELNRYAKYAFSKNPIEVQKNRGYVDGFFIAKSETKPGRPSSNAEGDPAIAFTIRLPQSTIDLIPAEKGKKRQWVQNVIDSILNQCECDVPRLPVGFSTTKPPHICDNCKKPIHKFKNNGAIFPWELHSGTSSAAQCPTPKKEK